MRPVQAVILAAGKGTRMGGDRPKVLYPLAGRPLLAWPLAALAQVGAAPVVVVVGHGAREVEAAARRWWPGDPGALCLALQPEQRGTGHAVSCALPQIDPGAGPVLILAGDVPGIGAPTLRALAERCRTATSGLAFAGFHAADPTGYGRVLRDEDGAVRAIREHADASAAERAVDLCNAGLYAVVPERLAAWLPRLRGDNVQGELYLTDLVALAARAGTIGLCVIDEAEAAGVNTPEQLAALKRRWPPAG